jgi:hypothetical protein
MNDQTKKTSEAEFAPDAWEKFERAVDVVAKSPPQPKVTKKPPKNKPKRKTSRAKRPA